MTSSELRQQFLNDYAGFLLKEYGEVVKGEAAFSALLVKPREDMWDLLKDIIGKAHDLEAIDAKNSTSVLTLLEKGKVSVDQAIKLMELIQQKQDIEELPKLREALENLNK